MSDRILIVANTLISDAEHTLPPSVGPRSTAELFVVAPTLTTRLQSLSSDVDGARRAAEDRLQWISADMRRFRSAPRTAVGDENQVVAVGDALAEFDADECVVVSHTPERENFHERRVAQRIRARFDLPTTLLHVDDGGRVVAHHSC